MTKFLPIFPLDFVVYPGQQLNLHIFEPRYKQLIGECREENKTFGIPSAFKNSLNEFGTEMRLLEVTNVYANGEMDIKTEGTQIFRIMNVLKSVPEKLYSAAIVYEVPHLPFDTGILNPTLVDLMKELHTLLETDFDPFTKFANPLSFDIAPYAALNQEDQYRLLSSASEKARQYFIIQHLQQLIPNLIATRKTIAKIQMNGHFRNEKSPDF